MGVVLLSTVENDIAAVLEIGPDDNTYGPVSTDQGAFTQGEIRSRILQADLDVRMWIADSPKNGHRNDLLVNSSDLANGALVPAHSGKLGPVLIKLADSTYVPGQEAPSLSALRSWLQEPSIFPAADIEGRFWIDEEEQLWFIGDAGRIRYVPPLTMDTSTPACQAPEEFTGAVTRRALANLPRSFNLPLIQEARVDSQNDEMAIRQGSQTLPPFRRAEANK